jgi:hypothetical protein
MSEQKKQPDKKDKKVKKVKIEDLADLSADKGKNIKGGHFCTDALV